MFFRSYANALLAMPWTTLMTAGGVLVAELTRKPQLFKRVERTWAVGLAHMWGMRTEVTGGEHMQAGRPYVVICNHHSLVDIPALVATLPVVPSFLAKKELGGVPVVTWAVRWGGHVLVDRGNAMHAWRTLKGAAAQIRQGKVVVVFPEGTRGEVDEIAPFKKGAFLLAKQAQASILPVGIAGSRAILPKGGLRVHTGRVQVRIGRPLSPQTVASMSACRLMEHTRQAVCELSRMPARPLPPPAFTS